VETLCKHLGYTNEQYKTGKWVQSEHTCIILAGNFDFGEFYLKVTKFYAHPSYLIYMYVCVYTSGKEQVDTALMSHGSIECLSYNVYKPLPLQNYSNCNFTDLSCS
jgi:hypothetical protein